MTVTFALAASGVGGAVYVVATLLAVLVGDTEPQGGVEHETVQLTPRFCESLATAAVNCCVLPAGTVAEPGETATLMEAGGVVLEEPPPHPNCPMARTMQAKTREMSPRFLEFINHPYPRRR